MTTIAAAEWVLVAVLALAGLAMVGAMYLGIPRSGAVGDLRGRLRAAGLLLGGAFAVALGATIGLFLLGVSGLGLAVFWLCVGVAMFSFWRVLRPYRAAVRAYDRDPLAGVGKVLSGGRTPSDQPPDAAGGRERGGEGSG